MRPVIKVAFPARFPGDSKFIGRNLLAILATIGTLQRVAFEFVIGLGVNVANGK